MSGINPVLREMAVARFAKSAFVPSDAAAQAAAPPGMPPMDPSMMGGAPPMPPGAPPMDPSMMGGAPPMPPGMPPMDPSMMGGAPPSDPAASGGPPDAMQQGIMDAVTKAVQSAMAQMQPPGGAGKGSKGKGNQEMMQLLGEIKTLKKLMIAYMSQQGVTVPAAAFDDDAGGDPSGQAGSQPGAAGSPDAGQAIGDDQLAKGAAAPELLWPRIAELTNLASICFGPRQPLPVKAAQDNRHQPISRTQLPIATIQQKAQAAARLLRFRG